MHIGDWYDDGTDAAYEELSNMVYEFNTGGMYNPFGWIAWIIADNGDTSVFVESDDGKFIARFANSPADELRKFSERLEEAQ